MYKDQDLLDSKHGLVLGPSVLDALRSDADWLASAGVMGYSLLLGVHVKHEARPANRTVNRWGCRCWPAEQMQLPVYMAGKGRKMHHLGGGRTSDLVAWQSLPMIVDSIWICCCYSSRRGYDTVA